jgi:hypothetical protein
MSVLRGIGGKETKTRKGKGMEGGGTETKIRQK